MDASVPSALIAILEGGPEDIPSASRVQRVGPFDNRIKLPHYGGYEHFERASGLDDSTAGRSIFRWVTRTEVAE